MILVLLSVSVYSQNKLTGVVKNEVGKTIENALISMPDLHIETYSNQNGEYNFTNIQTGNFTIICSHSEYDVFSVSVKLVEGENTFDIQLSEEHSHHIDEIIVSTSFNKMQSQNVMKVENKKLKELKQNGAITMAEGLKSIPGVNTVSTGNSISKPMIRGLSGNRVLVYTQGVRLENQQFGEEHGLGLNDNSVESIEVIKGPASLLYGSDAMGGVLYFNPEKFVKPNDFSVTLGQKYFSNTHGSNTNFGFKTSTENFKFTSGFSHTTHADYQIPNKQSVVNSRFDETDFKTGIGYQSTKFSSAFRYNVNQLNIGLPEGEIADGYSKDRNLLSPNQKVLSQIFSLQNKYFLKNSKIELDLGYINNFRNEYDEDALPALSMKLKTLNFDAKYYLPKMGKWETIFGLQGMYQINTNLAKELLIPDAQTNDLGAMFTTTYEFGKSAIQAGARYDNRSIATSTHGEVGEEGYFQAIDRKFNSFNGAVGYKSTAFKNFIVRANVASGFRAPNLSELTSNGVHEGSNRYEIGNSELKNEQNLQTDLNIDYSNQHFEFFVNGFYNIINNYIYIQPTGDVIDDNDVYKYVQNNANLYGGEAGVHFHPHPLDWLHITSSFESVIGKQKNGANLPLIPAQKWLSGLRTEFDFKQFKKVFIAVNHEYYFNQNQVSTFETPTKNYSLFNFNLGSQIDTQFVKMNWHFNIVNAFDTKYITHLSRLKADGISNMGRNFVFGIDFEF